MSMALGKRRRERQPELFIASDEIRKPESHPFYTRLNQVLDKAGFDGFAEKTCQGFYAGKMGRPGLAPGIYFRCLMIGYFEGIDSERGIAWRASDSFGLRDFLGYNLSEATPDHSTISRTRRLIALEAHQAVFGWVMKQMAEAGLVKGTTVGIDATTLEANAAMRTIVRRDTGESYQEFLARLAKESGIETPTREELARMDRKREKRTSNKDWVNPHDPDARVAKMKDGSTHMAHKVEHAVDMETGVIVAITLQGADLGDTTTIRETLAEAGQNIAEVAAEVNTAEVELVNPEGPAEVVTDKGYHSNAVLKDLKKAEVRSYIPEPDRGKRNWEGKPEEKDAVYGNRRRVRGRRGKRLLAQRGEKLERSFAHVYETGGMRRTHLRKHNNILKRLLVHGASCNLGILMRTQGGVGKPRVLQGRQGACFLGSWAGRMEQAASFLKEVLVVTKSTLAALIERRISACASWRPTGWALAENLL